MPGRHSRAQHAKSRALPAFLVVLLVVALGAGVFVYLQRGPDLAAAGCAGSLTVTVAVAPEIADPVRSAARALEHDGAAVGGSCVDFDVQPQAPAPVAQAVAAASEARPDLWVPDSSVWLGRVENAPTPPEVLTDSLARTPVVLAGPGVDKPFSWLEVLSRDDVSLIDPLSSSAPASALLAAHAESARTGASEDQIAAAMLPLAQRMGSEGAARTVDDLAADGFRGAAVLSEQQVVALRADGLAGDFDVTVPGTGTLVLDYPLVATSDDPAVLEAAALVESYLSGPDGAETLELAGFRGADLAPLPDSGGAGQVPVLDVPSAELADTVLRQWAVLTVPSRSLAVFDVSGSMDFIEAGQPRIDLAVEAATRALQLFPDHAQIGVWGFSIGLGGGTRDYRELVPVRPLAQPVGGGTQRKALASALAGLPELTAGGTGLYDTTLAAVRTVQDGYDLRAANSVVLLTDGENEDPGSLSLKELLGALERERDPARPVRVIAIGMGPEADARALQRIAAATGGRSYVARDSADITVVFRDALLSR